MADAAYLTPPPPGCKPSAVLTNSPHAKEAKEAKEAKAKQAFSFAAFAALA